VIRFWRLATASTPPIRDARGRVLPGSVAELVRVPVGGVPQTLLLRGHDARRPVLLVLHGGPGGSAMPLAQHFSSELEQHFVVAHWDQRGAGKSYSPDIPPASMTTAQMVADCAEVAGHLAQRFGQRRVLVLGHSWGTELAVRTLQQHPALFGGYVGVAQVVDKRRAEAISWRFALEGARRAGHRQAEARLAAMQPPGYQGRIADLLFQRSCVLRYGGTLFDPALDRRLFWKCFESHEYSLQDLRRLKAGSSFSLQALWNDRLDLDLVGDVPALPVPVLLLQGRCDRVTPGELTQEWFERLQAPRKQMVWFERSGHCPLFEEPQRFQQLVIETFGDPRSLT
jgi:proline iminopeptidase